MIAMKLNNSLLCQQPEQGLLWGCHTGNACTTICDRGQNALTDLDLYCIALVLRL